MKALTKAEEEIMHIVWKIAPCSVGQIRDEIEKNTGKKPPHSTISTMLRILSEKEFLRHDAYGRTFVYHPTISKEDYSSQTLKKLVSDYFEGSMNRLVSFLVEKKELNTDDLNDLLDELDDDEGQE
jgi:predicted transcriptional regulator